MRMDLNQQTLKSPTLKYREYTRPTQFKQYKENTENQPINLNQWIVVKTNQGMHKMATPQNLY